MSNKIRPKAEDITKAAQALFREGKLEAAAKRASEALRNARRLSKTSQEGVLALSRAANLRGDIFFAIGRFDLAERYYRESVSCISETAAYGDKESKAAIADAYTGLGHTLRSMGRYDESVGFQERGLALYRDLVKADPNLRARLAQSLHYMGDVLADLGEPEEAMRYYLRELRIARRLYSEDSGFLSHLVHGLNGVAYRLLDLQKFDQSLVRFRESLRYQTNSGIANVPNESWTHHGIGVALLHKRDLDGAISHLEKALEMRRRISAKNKRFLGALKNTLIAFGDARAHKGEKQQALQDYTEALGILNGEVYRKQVVRSEVQTECRRITEKIESLKPTL